MVLEPCSLKAESKQKMEQLFDYSKLAVTAYAITFLLLT